MNILLATYSYYPYNFGGTEIYVSGLATFLKDNGHTVTVIAGMPPEAYIEHPVFYEDNELKIVEYYFSSIRVLGVVIRNTNTTDIYRKLRQEWVSSWTAALHKAGQMPWDILHMHAHTAAIGLSLMYAVKEHSKKVKLVASYHLPLSCVKGTLMFANRLDDCQVKPATGICTACYISEQQNWPLSITRPLTSFIPSISNQSFPTAFKIKYLVKQFLASFYEFGNEINMWHVFSEQIRSTLKLSGIASQKIVLSRHGIDPVFFSDDDSVAQRLSSSGRIFLYAGRFGKAKGFGTLLKAWCSLPQNVSRELWIVGEGQGGDAGISEWISKAKLRNDIKWMGKADQKTLSDIMKRVHCTVIPSECVETGPLVFHESIAAGSDVLASDLGGCKELAGIYKSKSKMFKAGDVSSLSYGIETFSFSGMSERPGQRTENFNYVQQSYHTLIN